MAALPLPLPVAHDALAGLHLRRLQGGDAPAFRAAVTTPAIGRMLFRFPADWPLAEAEALVAQMGPRDLPPIRLAVDGGAGFLGSIGLLGDAGAGQGDLAYFLTPQAQGRGIMRPVLHAFVGMVFDCGLADELHAQVYHDNPASMALLRDLGFAETGRSVGACSAQRAGPEMQHSFALRRGDWP